MSGALTRLRQRAARLPDEPGVYFFKDARGTVLYIGKAKSLKRRVGSYFSRALDAKTQVMISKAADLEYRLTGSDRQAQIREAALVKKLQPFYNIDLKDDKSFPWIRISGEEFPVIEVCRRKTIDPADTSRYFGPYLDGAGLRRSLSIVRKIFGFRTCAGPLPAKPCLYQRIALCPAPCTGAVCKEEYRRLVDQIALFFSSRYEDLIAALTRRMAEASRQRDFEEAARVRDQIQALTALMEDPRTARAIDALSGLQSLLRLPAPPLRIETFDISNISGKEACGAMVSFYRGAPDKSNYRKFRIKTVAGIDDYDMLREVVRRRYQRVVAEGARLPDAVLIDGGKGHLAAAVQELARLGVRVPVFSIAKDRENIYCVDRAGPVRLRERDPALNLIRRMRDEAHRFAVAYHHVLRRKKVIGR